MTHPAYEIIAGNSDSQWLLTCDHACNAVPDWVNGGDLGLPAADMGRHIAADIGAGGLTRALAVRLGAPAILSRFSRLVIDPNRGADDPTLLMKLYDGTIIPANRHAGPVELEQRLDRLYRPYHAALAGLAARRDDTVICAIHSYTPQLRGRAPRPWHVGVLYSHLDDRLARPLLARLAAMPDLSIGDNQPYAGHLPGDAIDQHALIPGRLNVLIEVRQDLIADAKGQGLWAERLALVLRAALADAR